jgi:hypothetical protein
LEPAVELLRILALVYSFASTQYLVLLCLDAAFGFDEFVDRV